MVTSTTYIREGIGGTEAGKTKFIQKKNDGKKGPEDNKVFFFREWPFRFEGFEKALDFLEQVE